MYDVEMKVSPHVAGNERPVGVFSKVDAAMCNIEGVKIILGNHFYHFDSAALLASAKLLPEQHRVSLELFGCDH